MHHTRDGRDPGQRQHPEPQIDVDLLVDSVDGENAEGVDVLQRPRGSELVKVAFCDVWEGEGQGVQTGAV